MIELDEVYEALQESVKLQSHYASLLNAYDAGARLTFDNALEWIERLRYLKLKKRDDKNTTYSQI
jgi:hypothetical protein